MKQLLIISGILLLILCGCSEKEEVVLKKVEKIPAENISQETLPLVVLEPEKKVKTAQTEIIQSETPRVSPIISIGVVKTAQTEKTSGGEEKITETSHPAETLSPGIQISENISEQTKVVEKTEIIKKKTTPEITAAKSSILAVPGECLIYRIKWNFLNAGKLILVCKKEQINKQDVYHIVGLTIPEGIWTKFGYGYNRFDSYIDSKTNLPFYYYGYSASSSTSQITKSIIDQKKKTLTYKVKKYKAGKQYGSKSGTVKFSSVLFDGLSAIYAMRGIAGEQLPPTEMLVGITKITTLFLCFLEKNISNFPVGMRNYWLFQSESKEDEALFKKGKLFISISADNEKLPLLLKGKAPLGTGIVELISKKSFDNDFSTDSKHLTEILISTP